MARPRVALVFPGRIAPDAFFGFLLPSLGLERLGAAVEDVADVALFDRRFEADLPRAVAAFRPDLVALNVKTTLYAQEAYEAGRAIRRAVPAARMIAGGLHATASPLETLEHCHALVRGDGERPFRDLALGIPDAQIPGLVYRACGAPRLNPMAPPEPDMDPLRPPARHLRPARYRYAAAGLIPMDLLETSRGCTHACTFCSSGAVHPCLYRAHSPGYVVEEIRRIAARGARYVMLTDDHLGGDLARVGAICDGVIASGIRIAFFAFIRPFAGEMELKRKMVRAGFVLLSYGAESANPAQHSRYGKGQDDPAAFVARVNREWLAAGACYVGNSYVFGDVDEPREALERLGVHARRLDSTYIEPLYSQPYPGTRYREELARRGMLLPRPWSDFTEARPLVAHPQVADAEEMAALRARMWTDFFSPRKAAGVFRAPLHFRNVLGLPLRTVLGYMAACDYSVFGCVLEEKPYRHLHRGMALDWFRRALRTFEPAELDMTGNFEPFLDMLGFAPVRRRLRALDVDFAVTDGGHEIARLSLKFRAGGLRLARVYPDGRVPPRGNVPFLRVAVPLPRLADLLAAERGAGKILPLLRLLLSARLSAG